MSAVEDVAPSVSQLYRAIGDVWPAHRTYLAKALGALREAELPYANAAAGLVARIAGDRLEEYCRDYQWLCGRMTEEQLHFFRRGTYRLSSFEQARREIYDDGDFMRRYLNGLLIGRITWLDQLRMLMFYREEFLAGNPEHYRHLEVGPGHGLLLYFASEDPRCAQVTGMDVSRTSLDSTAEAMRQLRAWRTPDLVAHDLTAGPLTSGERWDSIVISEVLEHLERPDIALASLVGYLRAGGRIFVTIPVNNPMPDHIFLFRNPEEVVDLVTGSGLEIIQARHFTNVGISEDRARQKRLPIATAMIAQAPHRSRRKRK